MQNLFAQGSRNSPRSQEFAIDWRNLPLGTLAPFRYGKNLPERDRQPGNVPVYSSAGLTGQHNAALVHGPGLIIGRKGTVGKVYLADEPFWPIDTTFYIQEEPEKFSLQFLYYLLQTLGLEEMNSDSAVPGLNRENAHRLIVNVPPLPEQRAIAHILGTLDDKIELNRKLNETLEAMARALFKSWFVDFDPVRKKMRGEPTGLPAETDALFPGEMEDSELGEVPKGWRVGTVADLAAKIGMGPFGSDIKTSTFQTSGVPILKGQQLKNLYVEDGECDFVSDEHADRLANSNVFKGDIILTHRGTLGQVAMISNGAKYSRYIASQSQFYIRPLNPAIGLYLLLFLKSETGQHALLSNASGAGVPAIARPTSNMKIMKILIPSQLVLDRYLNNIESLLTKSNAVKAQNASLGMIRDTLLPKLISGELRVKDAERFVGAVV